MSLKDRIAKVQSTSAVAGESIDQGLRSYMLKVYNFMASGILLTGFIALGLFKFSVITDQSGNITEEELLTVRFSNDNDSYLEEKGSTTD